MLKKELEREFERVKKDRDEWMDESRRLAKQIDKVQEEKIRQLADVLGLFSMKNTYGYSAEQEKVYDSDNWGAIFFAIGKLKSFQEWVIEERNYDREIEYKNSESYKTDFEHRRIEQKDMREERRENTVKCDNFNLNN